MFQHYLLIGTDKFSLKKTNLIIVSSDNVILTLKLLREEVQFDPRPPACGFSKSLSSKEREKPWFLVTFVTLLKISLNFLKSLRRYEEILCQYKLIMINVHRFFGFFDITYLLRKLMTPAYSR